MKIKDGFIQGYNAQAAVDATAQVIVAHGLDAKQSDQHQLTPTTDAIEANLGRKPTQLSADAGYCSDANLAALEERKVDAYVAPGRAKHASAEKAATPIAAMRERSRPRPCQPYRLRKQLPEPESAKSTGAASASSCCAASRRLPPMGPRPRPQRFEARSRVESAEARLAAG